MMQPVQGAPARPPGEPPSPQTTAGELPLTSQQRTQLERLITRIIALTQQQSSEVWASLRHDLGLKQEMPLQSRHFPAAEQNLNQRLTSAESTHSGRQLLSQLTELLNVGNNRQAASDYIRQQFGQTALRQLSPEQLKSVFVLLQNGQMAIPQPQQRPATERPLLPAEHNTLNQQVIKLAAATGESPKLIWQSMLELAGVKSGELIPAKHFASLNTWLQARQTLVQQPAPTLLSLQTALRQPMASHEWQEIVDYTQQRWQATPQTVLTTAQIQDVLNQVFALRVNNYGAPIETRDVQPIYNPLIPSLMEPLRQLSARPGLALFALVVAIVVLLMVL